MQSYDYSHRNGVDEDDEDTRVNHRGGAACCCWRAVARLEAGWERHMRDRGGFQDNIPYYSENRRNGDCAL